MSDHIMSLSVSEELHYGQQNRQHISGTPFIKTKLVILCSFYDKAVVPGSAVAEAGDVSTSIAI